MIEIRERQPAAARAGLTEADRARVRRLLQPLAQRPVPPLGAASSAPAAGAASAAWAPAWTPGIGRVERLVTTSLMGYFAIMLLAALGVV